MPSRSFIQNRPVALVVRHTDFLNPSNDNQYYQLTNVAQKRTGSTWIRTPNWKQVVKSGDLPMNPYTYFKVFKAMGGYSLSHMVGKNIDGSLWANYEDSSGAPTMPLDSSNVDPLESDLADARARNKVLDVVKNQKVNLGQVFGERHQTVLLVQKTVERVIRTVVLLRKGNLGAAAGQLGVSPSAKQHAGFTKRFRKNPQQATADGWLELQYGWRPLLQDVYGALDLVQAKSARRVPQRAQKSVSIEDFPVRPPVFSGYSTVYTQQRRRTSVKYVLLYTVPNEFMKTLSEVGITNPALIVWELLPWSFVVDWFLPVGSFISSWDAAQGLQFEKGVKTTVQEVFQTATTVGGVQTSDGGRTVFTVQDNSWNEYHSVHIQRTPVGGFPSLTLPRFKNPVSAEHMANLFALLVSTFGRR